MHCLYKLANANANANANDNAPNQFYANENALLC